MSNLERPGISDAPALPRQKKGEPLDIHVGNLSEALRRQLQSLANGQNVGIGISAVTTLPPASESMRGRIVFLIRGSGGNPDEWWAYGDDGAGSPIRTQVTIP